MDVQFNETKLIAIYIEIDDLLKSYRSFLEKRRLVSPRKPTRTPRLTGAEICTILVCYHLSGYKTFEYYYRQVVRGTHASWFPDAPTYERFLVLVPGSFALLYLWAFCRCALAERTGLYFVDSKKLPVCHIKREHSHKVFKGLANKGKSSTGYFYGLKLHLAVNNLGEPVSFMLTPGNVSDNNREVLNRLLGGLKGVCVGDKGYLTALFQQFYENGLELVKKPRKNMRKLPVPNWKNKLINMRPVIESVFDIMGTVCDIDHTRHRSPINAVSHILAALVAYQQLDKKPCVFFPSFNERGANSINLAA